MKIVVIGGTGLIGSRLVALLRQRGQDVLAASPSSGVSTRLPEKAYPKRSPAREWLLTWRTRLRSKTRQS